MNVLGVGPKVLNSIDVMMHRRTDDLSCLREHRFLIQERIDELSAKIETSDQSSLRSSETHDAADKVVVIRVNLSGNEPSAAI